jgi:hypothetical protein
LSLPCAEARRFAALQRGGGELVAFHCDNPAQIADFNKRYPGVKLASEEEILNDKSIQLVASASIPDLRAPLGIRVMKAGKDYLADKPGITTLKQLADVRKAVKETGRKFAIMYSERLEVRSAVYAGELIKQGAIGRVVQTVNLGPHRMNISTRPAWFFDKARYGGILCDIGSHQADRPPSTRWIGKSAADRSAPSFDTGCPTYWASTHRASSFRWDQMCTSSRSATRCIALPHTSGRGRTQNMSPSINRQWRSSPGPSITRPRHRCPSWD